MTENKSFNFKEGDTVFHKTNPILKMVIIEINSEGGEITCRWIDKNKQVQMEVFLAVELTKNTGLFKTGSI